jgi:hypothetical protein
LNLQTLPETEKCSKNGFFRNKSQKAVDKKGLHIDGAGGGELWCRTRNDGNVSKIPSVGYE